MVFTPFKLSTSSPLKKNSSIVAGIIARTKTYAKKIQKLSILICTLEVLKESFLSTVATPIFIKPSPKNIPSASRRLTTIQKPLNLEILTIFTSDNLLFFLYPSTTTNIEIIDKVAVKSVNKVELASRKVLKINGTIKDSNKYNAIIKR